MIHDTEIDSRVRKRLTPNFCAHNFTSYASINNERRMREVFQSFVALVASRRKDPVHVVLDSQVASGTHARIHVGPSDIGCQYSGSIYTTRLIVWQNLVMPRTRRRIGDKAFSVAAPRTWTRLPTQLKLLHRWTRFVVIWNHVRFCLRAPGYGLTLWCALGLLVGSAVQVHKLQLQFVRPAVLSVRWHIFRVTWYLCT